MNTTDAALTPAQLRTRKATEASLASRRRRKIARLVAQIEAEGFTVTLNPCGPAGDFEVKFHDGGEFILGPEQ